MFLLTCAFSRAVHLELVRSQSQEELQLALRRLFALRGTPKLLVSDNAKSFRSLTDIIPATTTWRFISEASPWWGGWWERLVALTKTSLKITLHGCALSFDKLATTLYEAAFYLNQRPLTEDDEGEVLTPSHFLFGVRRTQRRTLALGRPILESGTRLEKQEANL